LLLEDCFDKEQERLAATWQLLCRCEEWTIVSDEAISLLLEDCFDKEQERLAAT